MQTNWLLTESVKSSVLKIGLKNRMSVVQADELVRAVAFLQDFFFSLKRFVPFLSGNGSVFHILLRNMNVKEKKSERAHVGTAAYAFSAQLICQACTSECKVIKTCV